MILNLPSLFYFDNTKIRKSPQRLLVNMDNFEQDAASLPKEDNFSYEGEDPQQVCTYLKNRILHFALDIEQLRQNPLFAESPNFLEHFANNLMAINHLTECSHSCSERIIEAGLVIKNILTCPVALKNYDLEISTLDAVKLYRKNKNNASVFMSLLKAYTEKNPHIDCLLNELKLLAHDLI